jgi:hypothetical protein
LDCPQATEAETLFSQSEHCKQASGCWQPRSDSQEHIKFIKRKLNRPEKIRVVSRYNQKINYFAEEKRMQVTQDALVLRADEQGICTLTLNRPDKFNALSAGMIEALSAQLVRRMTRS